MTSTFRNCLFMNYSLMNFKEAFLENDSVLRVYESSPNSHSDLFNDNLFASQQHQIKLPHLNGTLTDTSYKDIFLSLVPASQSQSFNQWLLTFSLALDNTSELGMVF